MVRIMAEAGSCHMGKLRYALQLIDLAVDCGCWAIKFQLFKNMPPNIELPRKWWSELKAHAERRIILYASVFDMEAIELLRKYHTVYTKFAYSQRKWFEGIQKSRCPIVSCSPEEIFIYKNGFFKPTFALFCIPEYPVLYQIDFDQIFKRYSFDGFSDHTLGYSQTLRAIKAGARMIEKHITLDHSDITCPDHYFALRPKELKGMMSAIKRQPIYEGQVR